MSQDYDEKIVQQYADKLYRRAETVTGVWCAIGLLSGGLVGGVFTAFNSDHTGFILTCGAISAAITGIIGFQIGSSRGFRFKLEAQRMLCQAQIERNTRKLSN